MKPSHLMLIKSLGYIPVGLGVEKFSKDWLSDKKLKNISKKNPYYGEYTFHYWLWKNKILKNDNKWIGFCQYRKFWVKPNNKIKDKSFKDFKKILLKKIPSNLEKYETILGTSYYVNQFRLSKFVKHNFIPMITNPKLIFNKKNRNIKFHFDMWHGKGNLDKAIDLLETKDKIGFKKFVEKKVSFNPYNMFICRNKKILFKYYNSLFPWLFRCEKIFGFKNLHGYGLKRIYGFLAERYMSYWFQKYTKCVNLKIHFKDLSDYQK